jgi:hypothetical protein
MTFLSGRSAALQFYWKDDFGSVEATVVQALQYLYTAAGAYLIGGERTVVSTGDVYCANSNALKPVIVTSLGTFRLRLTISFIAAMPIWSFPATMASGNPCSAISLSSAVWVSKLAVATFHDPHFGRRQPAIASLTPLTRSAMAGQ